MLKRRASSLLTACLALTVPLCAQSTPVFIQGQVELCHDGRICRLLPGQPKLEPLPELGPLPTGIGVKDIDAYWDGFAAYLVSPIGDRWKVQTYRWSPPSKEEGRAGQWMPGESAPLPDKAMLLSVSRDRALLQTRRKPGRDGKWTYTLSVLDLPTQTAEVVYSRSEDSDFGRAQALLLGGDTLLFLNIGSVALLKSGDHSLRMLLEDAWPEICPTCIVSKVFSDGHLSIFPPKFWFPPILAADGTIRVVMDLREKNLWSKEANQALFDAYPKEDQERFIREGKWPLKTETYEGSDEALVVLAYDPAKNALTRLPDEKLGAIGIPSPFVRQLILKPGALQLGQLLVAEDGRIVPLEGKPGTK